MIIIQGPVGAGKSTLSKLLSVREGLPLYKEPVESNPYLQKFYADPEGYAFQMQVFLLHERFKQHREADLHTTQTIMDMSIYGNDIFAHLQHKHGYMSWDDLGTYSKLSATLKSMIKKPDLMVYLKCSPYVMIKRILRRNRASEYQAPVKYWIDLYEAYEKWYESYHDSKKIRIDVDHLDFVADDSDEDYILDMIMEEVE